MIMNHDLLINTFTLYVQKYNMNWHLYSVYLPTTSPPVSPAHTSAISISDTYSNKNVIPAMYCATRHMLMCARCSSHEHIVIEQLAIVWMRVPHLPVPAHHPNNTIIVNLHYEQTPDQTRKGRKMNSKYSVFIFIFIMKSEIIMNSNTFSYANEKKYVHISMYVWMGWWCWKEIKKERNNQHNIQVIIFRPAWWNRALWLNLWWKERCEREKNENKQF